jgi:hypothetical protein
MGSNRKVSDRSHFGHRGLMLIAAGSKEIDSLGKGSQNNFLEIEEWRSGTDFS